MEVKTMNKIYAKVGRCPWCGSRETEVIDTQYDDVIEDTFRCLECGKEWVVVYHAIPAQVYDPYSDESIDLLEDNG